MKINPTCENAPLKPYWGWFDLSGRFINLNLEAHDNNKHCLLWMVNIIRDLNFVRDAMCCIFCPRRKYSRVGHGFMCMVWRIVHAFAMTLLGIPIPDWWKTVSAGFHMVVERVAGYWESYGICVHTLMPNWSNAVEVIVRSIGYNPQNMMFEVVCSMCHITCFQRHYIDQVTAWFSFYLESGKTLFHLTGKENSPKMEYTLVKSHVKIY